MHVLAFAITMQKLLCLKVNVKYDKPPVKRKIIMIKLINAIVSMSHTCGKSTRCSYNCRGITNRKFRVCDSKHFF